MEQKCNDYGKPQKEGFCTHNEAIIYNHPITPNLSVNAGISQNGNPYARPPDHPDVRSGTHFTSGFSYKFETP